MGFQSLSQEILLTYMHDFFIYNGVTEIQDSCGFTAGDVVIKLCQTLTTGNEHLIFSTIVSISWNCHRSYVRKDTFHVDTFHDMKKKGHGSYVAPRRKFLV